LLFPCDAVSITSHANALRSASCGVTTASIRCSAPSLIGVNSEADPADGAIGAMTMASVVFF
jgi:hypothetical protein